MDSRGHHGHCVVPWLTSALFLLFVGPEAGARERNPWAEPVERVHPAVPAQRYQEGRFVPPSYDPARPPRQDVHRSWDPVRSGVPGPVFIDPSLRFAPGAGQAAEDPRSVPPSWPPAYGPYSYPGLLGTPLLSPHLYPGVWLYPGAGWLNPGVSPVPQFPGAITPYGVP